MKAPFVRNATTRFGGISPARGAATRGHGRAATPMPADRGRARSCTARRIGQVAGGSPRDTVDHGAAGIECPIQDVDHVIDVDRLARRLLFPLRQPDPREVHLEGRPAELGGGLVFAEFDDQPSHRCGREAQVAADGAGGANGASDGTRHSSQAGAVRRLRRARAGRVPPGDPAR